MLFAVRRPFIAALLVAVFVACTPPTAGPDTSGGGTSVAGAKPAINEQTRGAIQALMQRQHDTDATRDQKAYEATFDPERRALVRCANEKFDIDGRQGVGNTAQVGKIEAYLDTYVRAWVTEGTLGLRRIFFRQLPDGKWVQTEPKDDELGGEKKTTVEDIQIDYWGLDQDVIDALGKGTLAAKKTVLENLLSESRRDALAIRFYPTKSVAGIQGCTVVGFHFQNIPTDPYVRFFRYWFNQDGTISAPTITFITHEWLHWAQDQFSAGITARLPWWLVEGWPDYVGQSRGTEANRFVICQTATPALKQLEDGADPNGPPELGIQYYSFANSMVEYQYATYSGKEGYKKLALAFKEDARPSVAFPKALGITPEKFYDDWKAWAKKKFCG
jgi:hypothetical protein